MKYQILLHVTKWLSFGLGFFGAFSLLHHFDTAFAWRARPLHNDMLDFGQSGSIALSAISLTVFILSTIFIKAPETSWVKNWLYRRLDFSLLLLLSVTVVVACYFTLRQSQFALLMFAMPAIAYAFAMLALSEFIARLRDKTMLQTLYWLAFFREHPIWKPLGVLSALLILSQLYLLAFHFFTPARIAAILALFGLTYFASHILELSKKFKEANEESISAERFKTELITNVSHDIRTPLTSIINYVDLLAKQDLQGETSEYVAVLEKKSNRLKVLIDDLMEASKAGTGNVQVNLAPLNLNEIIGQVAGDFEDSFVRQGLQLVIRQPAEPFIASSDSRHLHRVLENLFSNAAKYAMPETRVFVELANHHQDVLLTIQNTAKNPLERAGSDITNEFIRGDKARHSEGSGLGLYIAKSLCELMNHHFQVSVIGDLFRVDVLIPLQGAMDEM